jgi:cephalosporin hydroxylase
LIMADLSYKRSSLKMTAASSLWNQRNGVAGIKKRINDLCAAINWENDLELCQWVQLLSFSLEYNPDLILELGRGKGNSTCVFTEAANHLPGCKVVSVCNSKDWDKLSVPRVREVVPDNWFDPLTILRADILRLDYRQILEGGERILLFWDAHGFEVAECVLGGVLPLLADRDHLVLMHDISDSRYAGEDYFDYRGEKIWKIGPDEDKARMCLWNYNSLQEQLISILDFTTRNKLTLHSADHSLHTELEQNPEKMTELDQLLGDPFFSLSGHWFWFTLNETEKKLFFPKYNPPDQIDSFFVSAAVDTSESIAESVAKDPCVLNDPEDMDSLKYWDESCAAETLWKHRRKLAASIDRIKKLYSVVGNYNMISPYQWTQFIAFTLEFKPDLIVEIGRKTGNSTVAFTEAVYQLQPQQSRVLSVWPSDEWKKTYKKIEKIVPPEWFGFLEIYNHEIFSFPYEDHLREARKVLVFIDEHDFNLAEWFLGDFMPLIAETTHVVLVHDISDARYYMPHQRSYGGNKLWRSSAWNGESLVIGNVASSVEMTISLLDFTSRNGISLLSADHSIHTAFDNESEKVKEMRALLGEMFFDIQAHWRWFSLDKTSSPITFPKFFR